MTLVEVLAALAILAIVSPSLIGGLLQSFEAVRKAGVAELEVLSAAAFVDAVTLWTRSELDQRLGERRQGQWWLTINRPIPTLYVVMLADSVHRPLIQTSIFRSEPSYAP